MKTTLLILSVFLTTSLFGQEIVTRDSLYYEDDILAQFMLKHDGVDAKSAFAIVKNWASSAFINTKEVTVSEGDGFIVYKPILNFNFNAGKGVIVEAKITAHTKFQFKDGRSRVTITEMPSNYATSAGVNSYIIWPTSYSGMDLPSEYVNKDESKKGQIKYMAFRKYKAAIQEKNQWVEQIKSINFSKNSNPDDDW